MPAKVQAKASPKKQGVAGLHPDTKRIIDAAGTKKPGEIFEAVLRDAKQAKRRRDAIVRYVKRHKVGIKQVIQKGRSLYVEVGK